jgi:hypothetical protein
MARALSKLRQAHVTRTVKGALAACVEVREVLVDTDGGPPQQSNDCVAPRAFGSFRFRAPASIIKTVAFAIANRID